MSGTVLKRQTARGDIIRCYLSIADRGPDAADRFLDAVEECFERLAGLPGLGEPLHYRDPEYASVRRSTVSGFRNFVIYYQPIDGGIEVLRVVHAARDQSKILEEDDDNV